MIIFTSICANYIHKARTLAQSVRVAMPQAKMILCLTEKDVPSCLNNDDSFDSIVLSREMWNGNFERFIFKHDIVEASTAVKGQFFRYLFKVYPDEDCYIYLDPDCYVYTPFVEIEDALSTFPIVLCPHLLHPGNIDMELSSTAHGVYNLGFLAVSNSLEAYQMIDWWAERLYLFCYDDIPNGIFTDQKWIDLAPCFFNVKIMHHYGYDLAPWGLLGCSITQNNGKYFAQGQPIRFIHYSGFGHTAEHCMDLWLSNDSQPFRTLYSEYALALKNNDVDKVSETPWSYSKFECGEDIPLEVRLAYRKNNELMYELENPFRYNSCYFYEKLIDSNNYTVDPKNMNESHGMNLTDTIVLKLKYMFRNSKMAHNIWQRMKSFRKSK